MHERALQSHHPDRETRSAQVAALPEAPEAQEIPAKPDRGGRDSPASGELQGLKPAPIDPSCILQGRPVARNRLLAGSTDGTSNTLMWDCTAGRFTWYYGYDETVYVIEGSVTITLPAGSRRLRAGDVAYFPAGCQAIWNVENYVRKIAFCHEPMSRRLRLLRRLGARLARLLGR